MRDTPTRALVYDLISRRPKSTDACMARAIGVSRERVRQIRKGFGILTRRQPNTLISWPCPGCAVEIKMWTNQRHARKTAWCARCATREAGHARRTPLVPIVCPDCGKARIYKGRANALAYQKRHPIYRCQWCALRKAARERGHAEPRHPVTVVCIDCGKERQVPATTRSLPVRCRPCNGRALGARRVRKPPVTAACLDCGRERQYPAGVVVPKRCRRCHCLWMEQLRWP